MVQRTVSAYRRSAFRVLSWLIFLAACGNFIAKVHLNLTSRTTTGSTTRHHIPQPEVSQKQRLLYVVTTSQEFNTGRRETRRGSDRFTETLVPTIAESIPSLAREFETTLVLVAHYEVSAARRVQLKQALPSNVRVTIWDDATPLGYPSEKSDQNTLAHITRALARQHRYLIKDMLLDFDIVACFEDDMILRASHAHQYVSLTRQLEQARVAAPKRNRHNNLKAQQEDFWGTLTKSHYFKLIPGWIRVEAALPGWQPHDQNNMNSQVPLTFDFPDVPGRASLNSTYCCHVSASTASVTNHTPQSPPSTSLYFWETSLDALSVRKLSDDIGWVVMLAGNFMSVAMGSYWSGRDGYFGDEMPALNKGRYANNQGGWIGTQRQVFEWHTMHCKGGFLPPFGGPVFPSDGLVKHSVEAWSGGGQLVGQNSACKLQRVIPLHPRAFERHLLYHSSNNKQRSPNVQHRYSSRSIEEFWAQLNTVRKNAEQVRNMLQQ